MYPYHLVPCSKIKSHDLIIVPYVISSQFPSCRSFGSYSLPVTGKYQWCTIRMPSHMANIYFVSIMSQVTWLVSNNVHIMPSHMAIQTYRIHVHRSVNMPSHMASVASIGGKGL